MQSESLFRKEALAALQVRDFGRPIARIPKLWVAFGLFLFFLTICAAWFVTTSTYARKEKAVGWLSPDKGLIQISAGLHGRVERVDVEEGQSVHQGEVLFVLSLDGGLISGGQALEVLATEISKEENEIDEQLRLVKQQSISELNSIDMSLSQLIIERQTLQGQIREQDNRIAIAQDMFERFELLQSEDAASHLETQRQRETVAVQLQAKERLMQNLAVVTRQFHELSARKISLPLTTERTLSELRSRLSSLQQRRIELSRQGRKVITAPVSGRIASLGAKAGSSIGPVKPLISILPEESSLFADVYIPSRAIGFIKPGQRVRVMYDAFPHQRFGSAYGDVKQVSKTVLTLEELPTSLRLEEPAYRARLALDDQVIEAFGSSFPLRPGMVLSAEIILEERTFLQWLLEPLRARRKVDPKAMSGLRQ